MGSKSEEFRKNADDCRRRAERAANAFDRQHWLDVAEHWLKMVAAEKAAAAQNPDKDPKV